MTKRKGTSKERERGKNARNFGAVAEDTISLFAAQLGLVATKSQRDWEGWDLASDIPAIATDPWGLPTPPLICRFQIKATETAKRTVRLSRENVLRMVQQPIPWFLILVRHRGGAPHKIDLVHMGPEVIEEVLRWAITKPKATGFQLACDSWGTEVEPNSKSWFSHLEQQIGEKQSYMARKADWNEAAGRTQPRFRFSVESRNTTEEEIANFFLGFDPSMKIDSAKIFEERFGIQQMRRNIGAGTMELPTLAPSARVLLTARSANQLATVECQIYSTRPWMSSSSTTHRTRLKMNYFDLILFDSNRTQISMDVPETIDLALAAEEVRFFHVLHTAEEMVIANGDKTATVPPYKFGWTSKETDFFQAVLTTHQLFTTLGLRPSHMKLSNLLHGESLALVRAILGDVKAKVLSVTFRDRVHTNLPSVIVGSFAVRDDQHQTGFIYRLNGVARADQNVVFEVAELKTIDQFALPLKAASDKLQALLKEHADRIEASEGVHVDYVAT